MIQDRKSTLDNSNLLDQLQLISAKAFDSLPHGLVVAELYAYGVEFSASEV